MHIPARKTGRIGRMTAITAPTLTDGQRADRDGVHDGLHPHCEGGQDARDRWERSMARADADDAVERGREGATAVS